jgi:hypothetical protein
MNVLPDSLYVPEPLVEPIVSHLEMGDVETGILYDAGYTPVDFRNFDGSYNCTYSSDISVFYSILKGVKSCVVSDSVIIPVADTVMSQMSNYLETTHRVPVGIAVFDYNQIAPNAITNGSLGYQVVDNEIMLENVELPDGSNANPYEELTFAAFSPSVNIVPASVVYDFSSMFRFTNKSITNLAFDAGDGNGYQSVWFNPCRSVTYDTPSIKTLKLRITLDSNEFIYAKSTVEVILPSSTVHNDSHIFEDIESFTGTISSEGVSPTASISVRYANGGSFSKQPIIVAEAFDPFSDPIGFLFKGNNANPGHGAIGIKTFKAPLSDFILGNYDIVYIDWHNSTCSIQSNADILKQVIIWVNSRKPEGVKSILIGQSMGGLIARYALRSMEIEGVSHEVSTYVSDDAPHLGANVPLGYMYLAQMLFEKIDYTLISRRYIGLIGALYNLFYGDHCLNEYIPYLNELLSLRNGMSVKQMVRNYVNVWHSLDTDEFESFQETLRTIGFPHGDSGQGILNLCISKGGQNNYITSQPLLSLEMYGGLNISSINFYAFILSLITNDTNSESFLIPTCDVVSIQVKPFLNSGGEVLRVTESYRKDFSWGDSWTIPVFEYCKHAPYSEMPKDDINGSFYETETIFQGLKDPSFNNYHVACFGHGMEYRDSLCFVSTVSSLCYNKGQAFNLQRYYDDFAVQGVDLDKIPFDGYKFHNNNAPSYHLDNNSSNIEFVCAMDGIQVLDSLTTSGNRQFFVNKPGVSVTWGSSDSTVATIDSSTGIVTPVNYGTSIISANIDYGGGHLRLKRTLNLPPPSSIQFQTYTLSYRDFSLENDYLNDSYRITASASGVYPDDILPYIKYCWGRKLSGQSTITWTESNNLTRFVTIPVIDDHVIYFRVKYLNYSYSPTYSIICHSRPKIVPIDPLGNLYTEDMGDIIAQVKSGTLGETYDFSCLGVQVSFDHEPTLAELVNRLLDNDIFVAEVKKAKPWGEEDTVIVPYSYTGGCSSDIVQDAIVFQYNPSVQ